MRATNRLRRESAPSASEGGRPSSMAMGPTHEGECRALIDANPNLLVPWYLMASHAYHWMDRAIISNVLYDEICRRLHLEWDVITHHHKRYIDRSALAYCSGTYVTESYMPPRAFWALQRLLRSR
jgi:hypothetical protein